MNNTQTNSALADELEPCPKPWCMSGPPLPTKTQNSWRVICDCGVQSYAMPTKADAIATWNARTLRKDSENTAPADGLAGELLTADMEKLLGEPRLLRNAENSDALQFLSRGSPFSGFLGVDKSTYLFHSAREAKEGEDTRDGIVILAYDMIQIRDALRKATARLQRQGESK